MSDELKRRAIGYELRFDGSLLEPINQATAERRLAALYSTTIEEVRPLFSGALYTLFTTEKREEIEAYWNHLRQLGLDVFIETLYEAEPQSIDLALADQLEEALGVAAKEDEGEGVPPSELSIDSDLSEPSEDEEREEAPEIEVKSLDDLFANPNILASPEEEKDK